MGMVSNDVLNELSTIGCGEGDDARQEDMRVASAAYDEIKRLRARETRLREALQKYADEEYNGYNACGKHARAALAEEKK
jgi:hypothetical protein